MSQVPDEKLYETLQELSVIDKKKLDAAWAVCRKEKKSLSEYLLERDLITDGNLGNVVADLLHVPFIRLSQLHIPDDVLLITPLLFAKKHRVISYEKDGDTIKVAMENPDDKETKTIIGQKTACKIISSYATERDIETALGFYKKDLQGTFQEMAKRMSESKDAKDREQLVSKVVSLAIEYAYANRASDIHIEPEPNTSVIRFRIDGILSEVLRLPRTIHDQIISKIKVLSNLRIDEHASAQDGRLRVPMEEEDLDIRVSVVPTLDGEKAVLRLLSSRSRQFSLTDLGMSDRDLSLVEGGFGKPYGMVLSTGPTGSGKTTTIYSILKIINSREKNIATIEDPVEYEIEGINQIQVNPKTNLTFADGLRSILRQDPDSMFVGEIRDDETAGIAINSAMTGHLVLSTLHTNDAATALPRFIDMGIEPFLVASTVNVIVAQRLVRKICEKCRYSVMVKKADLIKEIGAVRVKKYFPKKSDPRLYKGKGCPVCHQTGYAGRIGIFEVLEVTEAIRKLIVQKVDSDTIAKKAQQEGMTTMLDDGIVKAINGVTTIEEILRATKE